MTNMCYDKNYIFYNFIGPFEIPDEKQLAGTFNEDRASCAMSPDASPGGGHLGMRLVVIRLLQ